MITPSPLPSAGCEPTLVCLINVAAKSAILLLAALFVDCLLGRRRALVRSSLWHATLAGLAILPLAALLFPPLSFDAGSSFGAGLPTPPPPAREPAMAARAAADISQTALTATPASARHAEGDRLRPGARPLARSGRASVAADGWMPRVALVALAGYVFGCLALAIRFVMSLRAVAALTSAASPLADERWNELLASWRQRLAIARRVRLLISPDVAIPVQVGWLRPSILLPRRVSESNDECTRNTVLVHELGHVRRADYGWNLLLRALSIVYWPHPLMWLADRRICQLREQACDELCVHWLGGGAAYRAQLIELAAGLLSRRPIASLGIAMSQPTNLARRLEWIKHSAGRPHCVQSALPRRLHIAAALFLTGVLGAASLNASAAEDRKAEDAKAQEPATPPARSAEKKAPPPRYFEERIEDREDEPVRVLVERVKRKDLTIETSQPCSLIAGRTADLYARVPGYIARLNVDIGDKIRKGQLLAEVDSPELGPEIAQAEALVAESEAEQQRVAARPLEAKAQLEAARADVQKAEAELEAATVKLKHQEKDRERTQKLVEDRAVDEKTLDEQNDRLSATKAELNAVKSAVVAAKALVRQLEAAVAAAPATSKLAAARLRVAQARLNAARKRGASAQLISPINGVLTDLRAHVGDFVGAPGKSSPVCTVADLQRMSAVTQIPERETLGIKRDDAARVFLDALPGKVFAAKVSRVAYNIDVTTRTLRVEIDIANADGQLRPGLFGAAAVALDVHRDVLSIPRSAYDGETVYTVVNGRIVEKRVKLGGGTHDDRVEVLSGLKEGDIVITGLADPKRKRPDWARVSRVNIVEPAAEEPNR